MISSDLKLCKNCVNLKQCLWGNVDDIYAGKLQGSWRQVGDAPTVENQVWNQV